MHQAALYCVQLHTAGSHATDCEYGNYIDTNEICKSRREGSSPTESAVIVDIFVDRPCLGRFGTLGLNCFQQDSG